VAAKYQRWHRGYGGAAKAPPPLDVLDPIGNALADEASQLLDEVGVVQQVGARRASC
jgi:hypothetical protein